MNLVYLSEKADGAMKKRLTEKKNGLMALTAGLEALSPLSVLARGYGIVQTTENKVARSVTDVNSGDGVTILVSDGKIRATVNGTEKEEKYGKSDKKF